MKSAFSLFRAAIPVGIALACMAFQPAAQADSRPERNNLVRSVRVSYADLDLTRETDAQILLDRLKDAAYEACGGDPRSHVGYDMMTARIEWTYRECRGRAVARAIAAIDMPQLTASSR